MNENLNETPKTEKSAARLWCENFWYHYKWHSIIAIFVVFTITVCSMQMCQRESYDFYVLYGGGKSISRIINDDGSCEYDDIASVFRSISNDYDENGEVSVAFQDVHLLSEDELKEAGDDVNYAALQQNNTRFRDLMLSSPYYLCFLSEELYLEYSQTEGAFCSIKEYAGEANLHFLDDGAVYLSSENLPFNNLPGICDLPEDTVICLRAKTVLSNLSKDENDAHFSRSEDVLRKIFAYGR